MEFYQCSVCFSEYHEETCIPKVLECGHSLCNECLMSILHDQKSCPKCRTKLSKDVEECPTNFALLSISEDSKVKRRSDLHDANFLKSIKYELNLKKNALEELMNEKDEIVSSIESNKEAMQTLFSYAEERFEADEIEDVTPDIEECLQKVNKSLDYNWETDKYLLRVKDNNKNLFLNVIALHVQDGKRVYACNSIGHLGEWRFGEITFSEDENRLNIHCLSSEMESNSSQVLLKDLKDCMTSRKDILPFVEFGHQRLHFSLTDDTTMDTMNFLKFCTGEEGHTIKGLETYVNNLWSSILDKCTINVPSEMYQGYERFLNQWRRSEVRRGDVILERYGDRIIILKWGLDARNIDGLIGKLHENCEIDFNSIQRHSKITDCGISIQL